MNTTTSNNEAGTVAETALDASFLSWKSVARKAMHRPPVGF